VSHTITHHKEARARFAQRLASRGGGFRASAVQAWPVDRLAKEVVRLNAENPTDELELLQLLYVELEPAIQIAFLESAGVKHDNGVIEETLEPPFCSSAAVNEAASVVHATFGDDGLRYLQALVRYSANAWPDIATHAAAITDPASGPATHPAAASE
jgi:hypothetical protein